jgi:hypothetical protein
MTMLAVTAIVLTTGLLALLCLNDPKRRRAARLAGEGYGLATRRMLVVAASLPGIACLLLDDAAAFLVWIGGVGVVGWLVTLLLTDRRQA